MAPNSTATPTATSKDFLVEARLFSSLKEIQAEVFFFRSANPEVKDPPGGHRISAARASKFGSHPVRCHDSVNGEVSHMLIAPGCYGWVIRRDDGKYLYCRTQQGGSKYTQYKGWISADKLFTEYNVAERTTSGNSHHREPSQSLTEDGVVTPEQAAPSERDSAKKRKRTPPSNDEPTPSHRPSGRNGPAPQARPTVANTPSRAAKDKGKRALRDLVDRYPMPSQQPQDSEYTPSVQEEGPTQPLTLLTAFSRPGTARSTVQPEVETAPQRPPSPDPTTEASPGPAQLDETSFKSLYDVSSDELQDELQDEPRERGWARGPAATTIAVQAAPAQTTATTADALGFEFVRATRGRGNEAGRHRGDSNLRLAVSCTSAMSLFNAIDEVRDLGKTWLRESGGSILMSMQSEAGKVEAALEWDLP